MTQFAFFHRRLRFDSLFTCTDLMYLKRFNRDLVNTDVETCAFSDLDESRRKLLYHALLLFV